MMQRLTVLLLLILPSLALTGCEEPVPIEAMAVSPDGRWLAVRRAQGELVVHRLDADPNAGQSKTNESGTHESIRFSDHALGELSWHPEQPWLAFAEHIPGEPPVLRRVDPTQPRGDQPPPLVEDVHWKRDPVWLDARQLAWRGDRDGLIAVWAVDVDETTGQVSGEPRQLLRLVRDISALQTRPGHPGEFLFQSLDDDGHLQFWLRKADSQLLPATDGVGSHLAGRRAIAFSADGDYLVFQRMPPQSAELVRMRLEDRTVTDALEMDEAAQQLAMLGDGRVLAVTGHRWVLWQPEAGWLSREQQVVDWGGAGWGPVAAWAGHGVAAAAGGMTPLVATEARRPDKGRVLAGEPGELLHLAARQVEAGNHATAEAMLEDVYADSPRGSAWRMVSALGLARIAREERAPARAQRWLNRALENTPPGSPEALQVQLEQMAVAGIEQHNPRLAATYRERFGTAGEQSLPELAAWLGAVPDAPPECESSLLGLAGALRAGDHPAAASGLLQTLEQDGCTTLGQAALRMILTQQFEPLGAWPRPTIDPLAPLIGQTHFQLALVLAAEQPRPEGPSTVELLNPLLIRWATVGRISDARQLVLDYLLPLGWEFDVPELLRAYLISEEEDRWIETAVTKIMLSKQVLPALEEQLTLPEERLQLRLAQTKAALTEGEFAKARDRLNDALLLLSELRNRGRRLGPLDNTVDLLVALYAAKIEERQGYWPEARSAYRRCLSVMDNYPEDWQTLPLDVAMALEAIEAGSHQPDLLQSYLRILRGMGDPLINPAWEDATLETALMNLATLERVSDEDWLKPYLAGARALCLSQLQRPEALEQLRAASADAPRALRMRLLLEMAVILEHAGRYEHASRYYGEMLRMEAPFAAHAQSMAALVRTEWLCGKERSIRLRLRDLQILRPLPSPWLSWLQAQVALE